MRTASDAEMALYYYQDETPPAPAPAEPAAEPTPVAPQPLGKLDLAVVSTLGRNAGTLTYKDELGRTETRQVMSKDVVTVSGERYARMKMSESAEKRGDTFSQKAQTFFERVWKGSFAKKLHETKEKYHGIEMMRVAGVETGITAEFDDYVEKTARERVEAQRSSSTFKKIWGSIRDLGSELVGREKDLHREKIQVVSELRQQYLADAADTKNPLFHLMHRDRVAREALAENVMAAPIDFLHEGDKKTESIKIAPGSKLDDFLKKEVLLKISEKVIADHDGGKAVKGIDATLRAQLDAQIQDYFFSDEFMAWKNSLPEPDRAKFENSFTYSTNILSQAEQVFVPHVLDNLEMYRGATSLDTELEITLGTAQLGPAGDILPPSPFSKERASKNQALFEQLSKLRVENHLDNAAGMFLDKAMRNGRKQEWMRAAMQSLATSEYLIAGVTTVAGRGLLTAARSSMAWVPVLGTGLITGITSGVKEYQATTELRGQWHIEAAEGYDHPMGANAARAEAMRRLGYHQVDLGVRAEQLQGMVRELSTSGATEDIVIQSLAYLADSKARIALGDRRGVSLFAASKNTPEGRGIFQAQETVHNKLRSRLMQGLRESLDGEAGRALREKVSQTMGFTLADGAGVDVLLAKLAIAQDEYLETGITLDPAWQKVFGRNDAAILRDVKIMSDQDKAFNKYRWLQAGKHAAVSGALGSLFALGAGHLRDLHWQTIQSGVERGPVTVLDHTLPTHMTGLPDGASAIHHPDTQELLGSTYTHIPNGAHWVADTAHAGQYDLVTDMHDGAGAHTLIHDATFTTDGHLNLTDAVKEDLAHNHLSISYLAHDPITYGGEAVPVHEGVDTTGWTHNLVWGEQPGMSQGGVDGWVATTLHNYKTPSGVERVTEINGVRNFWKGIEAHVLNWDNAHVNQIEGYHRIVHHLDDGNFLSAPQADNVEITGLPSIIATGEGHAKIAKLVDEAVLQHASGGSFSDEAHRIAWEMAYYGDEAHVPDGKEVQVLLEYFGEAGKKAGEQIINEQTFTPHDIIIRATENVTVMGEMPYEHVLDHSVWNPANLLFPVGGYYHPLEAVLSVKNRPSIERNYYYGSYPSINIEAAEQDYIARKSPRLKTNPYADLKQSEEINWYLEQLSNDEKELVDNFESQKDGIVSENTEFIACIPIYKEAKNIVDTLDQYARQVDKNDQAIGEKLTIVLYNNYTGDNPPDNTAQIVEDYIQSHPNMRIAYLEHGYKQEETGGRSRVPMGRIRRDLSNYVMSQISKQPNAKNILLISNDGDVAAIDKKYIINGAEKFKQNPSLDAIGGKTDFPEEIYRQIPTLYAEQRAWQFLDAIIKHKMNSGVPELAGANTMYRASVLAGVGGYNKQSFLGEDLELGWMIKYDRNRKDGVVQYDNKLSLKTNPRRAVIEWLKGRGVVDRYNNFTTNEDVYENKWNELIAHEGIKYDRAQLEDSLSKVRSQLYSWVRNTEPEQFDKYFARAMEFLGVKFRIENDRVIVTDDSELKRGLAKHVPANLLS